MFPEFDKTETFPQREEAVLRFWKERQVYQKTLDARDGAEPFVFYEGPPTANGMPHPGHCLTRVIKDVFPRYRTMRGYRCERKAGWDTHGLPVEVEVCKELGIHSKEEIDEYGVEPFIQKCQGSVWRYMQEWERLTERLGFWVNLDEAYVTYHESYIESVWWSLKQLYDRGLLYQGHKIVWWWAQGGTALSAGEVGQGYREVADPSVYVKFPLLDDDGNVTDTSLLVWTTTPWTLPSNQFAAVHPEIEYATVVDEEEGTLILANDLVEKIAGKVKREFNVESTYKGSKLVGNRYVPPFDSYHNGDSKSEWRVVSADFVTTDSGSGVVHQAPAFGEVDYDLLVNEQGKYQGSDKPKLINAVDPNGKFTEEGPDYCVGRWVKDCDKDIIRDLKERGLLFHREQYLHDYPFCWRAEEDPLIQYPRESWFIKTTQYKDQMLANNGQINWLPGHIKDGRFGKFLESNVDWALSRERYWGTPLPIWVCEETGEKEAIGGYDELLAKPGVDGTQAWEQAKAANPELPDDLRVHKPYIDEVTYDSPFAEGARMRRVSEVIDCWYDSGAMPFAQWGYRGEASGPKHDRFDTQFPADFISEAIDQTRGWFYSQLAISTMLWGEPTETPQSAIRKPQSFPHPFRNCIVPGLLLGEDGQKMSKSKRNYREPREIFDRYGADAMRWYFLANQPPWTSIRYSEQSIKDSVPEFLLRLWNVYSFFVIYAKIDGFDPSAECGVRNAESDLSAEAFAVADSYREVSERAELDRWVLSELDQVAADVAERMDAYDSYGACGRITEFVDALSNWYVRRSRDRFWSSDQRDPSKLDAYWTLYECLVDTAKIIAPFVPFLAESLWQNLAVSCFGDSVPESIHLCDWPSSAGGRTDAQLSTRMGLVRHISSLGRQARTQAELKVRQPLASVIVLLAETEHQPWLAEHAAVICDELNVKAVEFSDEPERYVDHEVLPNFKLLGPKLGKLMPKMKQALNQQSGSELLANIRDNGRVDVEVEGQAISLTPEEIEVRLKPKEGWTAANAHGVVVVLSTELTDELILEGLARDLVRVIQDRRKEMGCEFTDRIAVGIATESSELQAAVDAFEEYISTETLADAVAPRAPEGADEIDVAVGDHQAKVSVQVMKA